MSEPVSLLDGLATTRAIRRYTDDPIPDDDLATILWHAGRAPSGSNRQPFRFLVLRDGPRAIAAKSLLGEAFRAGWEAKREGDGYRPSRFADSMQQYVDRFEQTPVVVLVCLERYRGPSPYEGASVYPACQNLLLAARALGYGGALTMWHLGVEAELRDLLEVPDARGAVGVHHARRAGGSSRAGQAQAGGGGRLRRHLGAVRNLDLV